MIWSEDVARVGSRADGSDGDAEETEDTGDHVDALFAGEHTIGAELGVWGGDLTGCDYAKEIDEEEVPLRRVGDLGP